MHLECRLNHWNFRWYICLCLLFWTLKSIVPDTAFHCALQQLATHCEFLALCVKPKPNKDEHSQQSFFSISTQLVSAQNTGLGPTSDRGIGFPPLTVKSFIVQISRRQHRSSCCIKKTVQSSKEEQQQQESSKLQLETISDVNLSTLRMLNSVLKKFMEKKKLCGKKKKGFRLLPRMHLC